jgi:hypothetical protein
MVNGEWLRVEIYYDVYISQINLPAIFLLVIFWREGQKCRTSNIFAGKELVQFYVRGVGGKGKRERRRFFYRSYVGIVPVTSKNIAGKGFST